MTVDVSNPKVFHEFEDEATSILIHMGVHDQALLEITTGEYEPSGLLPFQMPSGMKVVEEQFEDMSGDMEPHIDSEGNR